MRNQREVRAGLAVAAAVLVGGLLAGCEPAPAGTDFWVTSTVDGHDADPGNGQCRTAGRNGSCTLRAAVEEAEANSRINDIIYVLPGSYPLPLGDLDITTSLRISGAGVDETIILPGSQRAFTIGNAAGADPISTVQHVTIAGANLPSTGAGGAIRIFDEASANVFDVVIRDNTSGIAGGAIFNDGRLDLRRAEIRDNTIGDGATIGGGVTSTGGGIYNSGVLKVSASTIAGNESSRGGGIANVGGDVDLTNTTVSGNLVFEGGGGIYNTSVTGQTPGTAVFNIANSTITRNEAFATGSATVRPWGGGILNLLGGQISIGKSVVAENTDNRTKFQTGYSPDCYSANAYRFTSHRSNLVGILTDNCILRDTTWGNTSWIQFGDADDPLDPDLGTLGSNQGPTRTHMPTGGSPLLDAATSGTSAAFFDCPGTDQRGVSRPVDADGDSTPECDIGAVERSFG